MLVTRNKSYGIKWRLAKGGLTICVGSVSKVDVINHRMLPLPLRLMLNLNNCYLMFALSIDMIILEQLAMFDTAKVEIKKEHQLLMVSKTTSLRRAREQRDTS